VINEATNAVRAVVQRIDQASVEVEGRALASVAKGLLVFVGVAQGDSEQDVRYLARKIIGLRVFEDSEGKMNLSVADVNGGILLVSQFTLCADCRKGRRPSFTAAAPPAEAQPLYEALATELRRHSLAVQTGLFQAKMRVKLVNDGPVTMLLDSRKLF